MARVYVSLGSNIEREHHIRAGLAELRACFGELILSPIYESEAVGFSGDPFYNLVAGFDTEAPAAEVARLLREIEEAHGRLRQGPRFASRTLDIDLLLYDDLVCDGEGLRLPRDEITRNAFVLRPLADVAPQMRHPVLGRTYRELWESFDQNSQRLWPVPFNC